jgi:hypothetical protein
MQRETSAGSFVKARGKEKHNSRHPEYLMPEKF